MALEVSTRPSGASRFEQLIANNPPVLSSLIAQLPTESVLALCQTSNFLRSFFRQSPTSWRYISCRLHQPTASTSPNGQNTATASHRQSSNYALDQLLMYVIIPFSTRLTSLELDNTAVSGATLFQTVMVLRKETLEHVSVRGCKNVSLKYHINPWLTMHAMALDCAPEVRPAELQKLALKSLYTYRCRHHRRRPYLPSSLVRKESDSEPTHELVNICHKLGIWTDTAWCTTPGARCYRRRGYVTMRVPQDPREVWVVFDRLWRSRNWLGPVPDQVNEQALRGRKRKRDGRLWEQEEEAINGESIRPGIEGKSVPAHMRRSHTQFVDDIRCNNCNDLILERCEQCSVMMHCAGCRKTLCASCAFDRPYTRNKNATDEERNRFWWAPGCAVSPCSMQDIDLAAVGAPNQSSALPNIKFKWCCTEPVFSGGGGITLGGGPNQDTDKLRAAPLVAGHGFEDPEFCPHEDDHSHDTMGSPLMRATAAGPGGRWASLAELFRHGPQATPFEQGDSVPRVLCDDCYSSEHWKIKCKACANALCLKHDVKEKQRVRICGYRDLAVEKQDLLARLKATRLFKTLWLRRKTLMKQQEALKNDLRPEAAGELESSSIQIAHVEKILTGDHSAFMDDLSQDSQSSKLPAPDQTQIPTSNPPAADSSTHNDPIERPLSPGSNSTGPLSRASSPAPSARSVSATPEPTSTAKQTALQRAERPAWRGCQAFFCSANRSAGDHRRRCNAIMRQCRGCKVHVCDDCFVGLEPPCQCKKCRLPDAEIDVSTGSTAAFYCPNCRHDRSLRGQCKNRALALSGHASRRRSKKNQRKMPDAEKTIHIPNLLLSRSPLNPANELEYILSEFFAAMEITDTDLGDEASHNIQELQEMGETARDLVRRIQSFREQAGPGSAVASALPNIIIEGIDRGSQGNQPQ